MVDITHLTEYVVPTRRMQKHQDVTFKLLEITAEPGEYCIIFNSMGTGGYSGTFDFGID